VGLSSLTQTLTLTNNGGLALNISNIAISPGFSIVSNTCATTLAVNTACTLSIVFAPMSAGTFSGALTLTDNAPSGTQTTGLSGTGIDFTLAPNGPTSMTLSSGTSVQYPLLLSSLGTISGNVAFTCTGAPANSHCNVMPTVAALGGTQSVIVTVQTGTLVELRLPKSNSINSIFLALLLVLPLARRRRRTQRRILRLCGLLFLSGCAATPRVIPPASGPVNPTANTPSGSYNLTVSGASAGVTHTVGLTLIVQ
jgi:hypothetical protein